MPFYAVRRGKSPGVYTDWPTCQSHIVGFKGPVFKKFDTEDEAWEFVNGTTRPKGGSKSKSKAADTVSSQVDAAGSGGARSKRGHSDLSTSASKAKYKKEDDSGTSDGMFSGAPFSDDEGTVVYTDGASFCNGADNAQAGIGVYWGPNHKHNISVRLPGRQTNNRAEIHAAEMAIQQAKDRNIKNLILHTDSQFLISGITQWIKKWKRNDWKLSTGGDVINREDFEKLDKTLEGMNVKWVHVRGHSGIEGNEAADKLANQGAKKSLPR